MAIDESKYIQAVNLLHRLEIFEHYKDYVNEVVRLMSVWYKGGTSMRLFHEFLRNTERSVGTMQRLKAYRGLPGTAGTIGGAIDGTILSKLQELNELNLDTIYTLEVNRKTYRLVVSRYSWVEMPQQQRFTLINSGNFFLTQEEGEAARDRAMGVI